MINDNMNDKKKEFIEKIYLKINEAIEEANLNYIKFMVMDLLHFGFILNDSQIIYITSEIKSLISAYIFIIEDYIDSEDDIEEMKSKVYRIVKDFFEILKKDELNDNDKLKFFDLIHKARIDTELIVHKYTVRGFPKSKIKIPPNMMELEE